MATLSTVPNYHLATLSTVPNYHFTQEELNAFSASNFPVTDFFTNMIPTQPVVATCSTHCFHIFQRMPLFVYLSANRDGSCPIDPNATLDWEGGREALGTLSNASIIVGGVGSLAPNPLVNAKLREISQKYLDSLEEDGYKCQNRAFTSMEMDRVENRNNMSALRLEGVKNDMQEIAKHHTPNTAKQRLLDYPHDKPRPAAFDTPEVVEQYRKLRTLSPDLLLMGKRSPKRNLDFGQRPTSGSAYVAPEQLCSPKSLSSPEPVMQTRSPTSSSPELVTSPSQRLTAQDLLRLASSSPSARNSPSDD